MIFKERLLQRSSRPLELIHTDVCGPISPATWDYKRYILTLIDDLTHFTMVYILSERTEVLEYVMQYEAYVTSKHNLL